MPIQILRPIFVAINHRVSGLMGQKYSILVAGRIIRPAVSRNKDKFVDVDERGKVPQGWIYGIPRQWWTLSRFVWLIVERKGRKKRGGALQRAVKPLRESRWECEPNERDLQIGIDHSDHWYLQFKVVSLLRRGALRFRVLRVPCQSLSQALLKTDQGKKKKLITLCLFI